MERDTEKFLEDIIIRAFQGFKQEHSTLMLDFKEDLREIKDHLKQLNGSIVNTKERVTRLEERMTPLQKIIWGVAGTVGISIIGALMALLLRQ